nr:MAK10-like protein [Tanacetum cinerariifolium]
MGDENPIRTLGDYSKPSHEGYSNTIELPVGNNVVNKVTTSCEICSGSHNTQYCIEVPKQAFVKCAFSRIDEAGGEMSFNYALVWLRLVYVMKKFLPEIPSTKTQRRSSEVDKVHYNLEPRRLRVLVCAEVSGEGSGEYVE